MKVQAGITKDDFVVSINAIDIGQGKPVDFLNIALASNPDAPIELQLPVMDTFGINKTYGGQVLPTPSFALKMDKIVIDRERSISALKEEIADTPDDAEPHACLVYMKINEEKASRPDDRKIAQMQLNLYNYLMAIREAVVDWFLEPMEVERKGATRMTTRAVGLLKKQDLTNRMAIRGYFMSSPVSKYDTPGNASENVMEGKYGPNIKINIKPERKYAAKTLVSTAPRNVSRGFGANSVTEQIRVEDKAYAGCRIRAMVRIRGLLAPKGPVVGLELVTFQYLNRTNKRQIQWDDDDLTEDDRRAADQEAKRMKTEPSNGGGGSGDEAVCDSGDHETDGYGGYGTGASNTDLGLDDML